MEEIWKSVVGWEKTYEVSSFGRVKSFDRLVPAGWGSNRRATGRILTNTFSLGYCYVFLSDANNRKRCRVHKLVLEAFVGPRPEKYVANHINGNKKDNRIENLEWVTSSENEYHSYRVLGKISSKRKLSLDNIIEIRESYKSGKWSYAALARKFNVCRPTITRLIKGITWKGVI